MTPQSESRRFMYSTPPSEEEVVKDEESADGVAVDEADATEASIAPEQTTDAAPADD